MPESRASESRKLRGFQQLIQRNLNVPGLVDEGSCVVLASHAREVRVWWGVSISYAATYVTEAHDGQSLRT